MSSRVAFAWQDKAALRKIRESIRDYDSALGVYLALTVAASDAQNDEFTTTHKWLAGLSGFSERTVRDRLHDLREIGLVGIVTPKLRSPCTYKLLPSGDGCPTAGNGCRAFGNGAGGSVADIRRTEEKNLERERTTRAREQEGELAPAPSRDEVLRYAAKVGVERVNATKFFEHYEGNNMWHNQNGALINWQYKLANVWLKGKR